jgi:hypothetical protein
MRIHFCGVGAQSCSNELCNSLSLSDGCGGCSHLAAKATLLRTMCVVKASGVEWQCADIGKLSD